MCSVYGEGDTEALTKEHKEAIQNLILFQKGEVTHFYGGPLDIDSRGDIWVSPAEVGTDQFSYFHILYVNTTPLEALQRTDIPVNLLEIDEVGYKLTLENKTSANQLRGLFETDEASILIRPCNSGMAYYPRAVTPNNSRAALQNQHMQQLLEATHFREPDTIISLSKPHEGSIENVMLDDLNISLLRSYLFGTGTVNLYGITLDDDPWKYYEIITPGFIEDVWGEKMRIRIDSGCDIGQIYNDSGCDCREQMHTAICGIQEAGNGAIIHIPAQDGRGFGMAAKMETEGLKRGIPVVTNRHNAESMDTIAAAKSLLGETFDIRSYEGVGRILGTLGVSSVLLETDNRKKVEGIQQSDIEVWRIPTGTQGMNGSKHHVEAKHNHADIYYAAGEQDAV